MPAALPGRAPQRSIRNNLHLPAGAGGAIRRAAGTDGNVTLLCLFPLCCLFLVFFSPFHKDVPGDGCSTHVCPAPLAGGRRCWSDPAPRGGTRCLWGHRALFQPYFPPWTIGTRLGGCWVLLPKPNILPATAARSSLLCQHLVRREGSAMGSALALGPKYPWEWPMDRM